MHEKEKKGHAVSEKTTTMLSQICTLVIGLIIFGISINPPSVIWKINMFAFGGLESAFFWIFLLGMFWKKVNKAGAISAIIGGTVCYCVTMFFGWKIANLHQILIGISVSLLCMVIGSVVGKKTDDTVLKLYF